MTLGEFIIALKETGLADETEVISYDPVEDVVRKGLDVGVRFRDANGEIWLTAEDAETQASLAESASDLSERAVAAYPLTPVVVIIS